MITIETELKRRTDLIECPDFINKSVKAANKLGITAKDWNENRTAILLMLANNVCKLQNEQTK
jgi:hypothetical protein